MYYCVNTVIHCMELKKGAVTDMSWNLNNAVPIYQQIQDRIKNDIISGKYLPGQKLPGVRDLATEASVNPNTMQRALTNLEQEGLIITLGTNGRVVTSDLDLIKEEKYTQFQSITMAYLQKVQSLGFSRQEASDRILQLEEE